MKVFWFFFSKKNFFLRLPCLAKRCSQTYLGGEIRGGYYRDMCGPIVMTERRWTGVAFHVVPPGPGVARGFAVAEPLIKNTPICRSASAANNTVPRPRDSRTG